MKEGVNLKYKKKKFLSIWKVYDEKKFFFVAWYNLDDVVETVLEKNLFENEMFKTKKVSFKTRLLISTDKGKNYFHIDKTLKKLDNDLKEPYIFDNKYVI